MGSLPELRVVISSTAAEGRGVPGAPFTFWSICLFGPCREEPHGPEGAGPEESGPGCV